MPRVGPRSVPWSAAAVTLMLAGAGHAQSAAPDERPALIVVVSVDQLATWVFEAATPHFTAGGGFRRLLDEGVHFTDCAFRHGSTETGPGHATIGTGAAAAVHGIVANQWLDPVTGRKVYCATSPGSRAVGGGVAGRGPGTLLVPTFGDALKEQVEGCRVVSLSLKDRAAILMAGARADIALWFDQASGRFVSSTAYVDALPAWLERFDGAFPTRRFFGRRWGRIGPPSAYEGLVDDRVFEGRDPDGLRTLPERIDGGLEEPGPRFYSQVYTSPFGNEMLVDLARAAIAAYRLGADDVPDLLCVGFSATDSIGHRNGPLSVEVRDALLRLDRQLADLMRTLDARVGRGRYALLLSSDHGVVPSPESRQAAGLSGGRAVRRSILVRSVANKTMRNAYGAPPEGHDSWVQGISGAWLYLDRSALERGRVPRDEAAARVAAALAGLRGVHAALPTVAGGQADGDVGAVLAETADPDRSGDATVGGWADGDLGSILADTAHPDRSGDVWVVGEPYWLGAPSPAASHGSPWGYDREVPLFAWGFGLRRAHRVTAPVTPGVIAVLAAALARVEPPAGAREPLPRSALR